MLLSTPRRSGRDGPSDVLYDRQIVILLGIICSLYVLESTDQPVIRQLFGKRQGRCVPVCMEQGIQTDGEARADELTLHVLLLFLRSAE